MNLDMPRNDVSQNFRPSEASVNWSQRKLFEPSDIKCKLNGVKNTWTSFNVRKQFTLGFSWTVHIQCTEVLHSEGIWTQLSANSKRTHWLLILIRLKSSEWFLGFNFLSTVGLLGCIKKPSDIVWLTSFTNMPHCDDFDELEWNR